MPARANGFLVVALGLASTPLFAADGKPVFAIKDSDRVVIYGDSITSHGCYPELIETYVRTRFPKHKTRFWERGWSGDNMSNIKRFERDCLSLEPDVVLINMGMNDARYQPDIQRSLSQFVASLTQAVELTRKANPAARVYFISPVTYDASITQRRMFYPYVLWCFAREQRDLARRLGVGFIDLNRQYAQTIGMAYAMFRNGPLLANNGAVWDIRPLAFSNDGIHPNTAGHVVMGVHILKGLGARGDLASLTVDVRQAKTVHAQGQTARLVQASDDKVVIERTLHALPFPVPPGTGGAVLLECIDADFNHDRLTVVGLGKPCYRLIIDGRPMGSFQADELADGVNLSRLGTSPDYQHAQQVYDAVKAKHALQDHLWHGFLVKEDGSRPHGRAIPEGHASLKKHYDEIDLARSAVCRASTPRKHTFVLLPSATKTDRYQRLQRLVQVTVDRIPLDADLPLKTRISVALKNLSSTPLRVYLHWVDGQQEHFLTSRALPPLEQKKVTSPVTVTRDTVRPALRVSYAPVDGSFPRLTACYDVRLCPLVAVPKATAPVAVDGDLAEWRKAATVRLGRNHLTPVCLGRWRGPQDLSIVAKLMWDARYLYLGMDITDDQHGPAPSADAMSLWRNDSIQTAFWAVGKDDQGKSRRKLYMDMFGLTAPGPVARWHRGRKEEDDRGVLAAVKRQRDRTVYEVAWPWRSLWPATPQVGAEHRIAFGANDRDGETDSPLVDDTWKYMSWTFGIWYGNNPHDYGRIRLEP